MSILEVPRAYFRGNITWDPQLNNNYSELWDLKTSKPIFNETNGETVEAYRKSCAASVLKGNWNPQGSHRCAMFDTFVSGVDVGEGFSDDDGFVGSPVNLLAMLVDVDPYVTNTSQMFYDKMSWGINGSDRILARRDKRMTDSHINFVRNPNYSVIAGRASVIWQASFPWDNLTLDNRGSKLIGKFHDARSDTLGLTMRMNTYRTVYYGNYDGTAPTAAQEQELRDAILNGGFHPNPAVSVLVGTIGLWRKGEPALVPGDRFLPPSASGLGSAYARAQGDKLWIDFGNSIPETGFDLHKKSYGKLTVSATATEGARTELGTLSASDYDKSAYEKTSGLVYVELDTKAKRDAVSSGLLSINSADIGAMFDERQFHACPEDPSVYLDQKGRETVKVLVLDRGVPAPSSRLTAAVLSSLHPQEQTVTTDSNGCARICLRGSSPGESPVFVGAWQGNEAPTIPTKLNSDTDAYISLRVWPLDTDIATLEPTWANVHEKVLRDWESLAPCMDNWLLLGNEEQCKAYASLILRLTSIANFDDYLYMPVTRGMTSGQRTLLHNWCHKVLGTRASAAKVNLAAQTQEDLPELLVGGFEPKEVDARREFERLAPVTAGSETCD